MSTDFTKDELKRIGKNIRFLRERTTEERKKKMSLRELGELLGKKLGREKPFSDTTISNYEIAEDLERCIKREYVEKIAEIFEVPVNSIIDNELTEEYMGYLESSFDISKSLSFEIICFLIDCKITSTAALKNNDFINAEKLFADVLKSDDITLLTNCRKHYYKSFKTSNCIEGAANTLMMLILEHSLQGMSQNDLRKCARTDSSKIDVILYRDYLNYSTKQNREKFATKYQSLYSECLSAIKKNEKTKDLAELYMSFRYLFSICNNQYTDDENSNIGICMMLEFSELGNPLCKKFCSILDNAIENNLSI